MFVVTVLFEVNSAHIDAFTNHMHQQAENSLQLEPGCHQFDVAIDPQNPGHFYLYELYTDKAAFDQHLDSDHFKSFDVTVQPMLENKTVRTFERTYPQTSG